MKLCNWTLILCVVFLSCSDVVDPDPFGCNSREPLIINDISLNDGYLGLGYDEILETTGNLCCISISNDTIGFPAGLSLKDTINGWHLSGIPEVTGSFSIPAIASEFGTQCVGRDANFNIQLTIKDTLLTKYKQR